MRLGHNHTALAFNPKNQMDETLGLVERNLGFLSPSSISNNIEGKGVLHFSYVLPQSSFNLQKWVNSYTTYITLHLQSKKTIIC